MPRAFLRLRDHGCEATVNLTPPAWGRVLVRCARQQRVRETDAPCLQLHEAQLGCFAKSRTHVRLREHALDHLDGRIAQRRGDHDDLPAAVESAARRA